MVPPVLARPARDPADLHVGRVHGGSELNQVSQVVVRVGQVHHDALQLEQVAECAGQVGAGDAGLPVHSAAQPVLAARQVLGFPGNPGGVDPLVRVRHDEVAGSHPRQERVVLPGERLPLGVVDVLVAGLHFLGHRFEVRPGGDLSQMGSGQSDIAPCQPCRHVGALAAPAMPEVAPFRQRATSAALRVRPCFRSRAALIRWSTTPTPAPPAA